MSSISHDHFIEQCVSLWHLADFLLLGRLKSPLEEAIHHYCDRWMKEMCKIDGTNNWNNETAESGLAPWALDLISGVRQSYKWNAEPLKAVLMEFLWVGRVWTFQEDAASDLLEHLKDVPDFAKDLLVRYASDDWIRKAVWAPQRSRTAISMNADSACRRCGQPISWKTYSDCKGQVYNPFDLNLFTGITTGWCRGCSDLDTIPWRK